MASSAVHPCDERLPAAQLLTLGIQHVLVMYAGAVAVPLILGAALCSQDLHGEMDAACVDLGGLLSADHRPAA